MIREQSRSDKGVDLDNLNLIARTVRNLTDALSRFNPAHFHIRAGANGAWQVSLANTTPPHQLDFQTRQRGNRIVVNQGHYRTPSAIATLQAETNWDITASGWLFAEWSCVSEAWLTAADSETTNTIIKMAATLPTVGAGTYCVPIQKFTVVSGELQALPPQTHAGLINPPELPLGAADYEVMLWDETDWKGDGAKRWVVDEVRAT